MPADQTDYYQPLDRQCFGSLKAISRHQIRKQITEHPEAKFIRQTNVQNIICSWEHHSTETVLNSWSIYDDDQ